MYKKIDNPEKIKSTLESMFEGESKPIIVYSRDDQIFSEMELLENGGINLRLNGEAYHIAVDDMVEVVIHAKEISYSFETRIINIGGDVFGIQYPEFMLGFKKKNDSVHQSNIESAVVKFDFSDKTFRVESVGMMGIIFLSDEEIPCDGLLIRNASLRFSRDKSFLFDARAKLLGKDNVFTYRLTFLSMDYTLSAEIIKQTLKNKFPELTNLGIYKIEEVFQLFNESGCFDDFCDKDIDYIRNKFEKAYAVLAKLEGFPELMHSFAYIKGNIPLAGCTAVRIFKNTFFTRLFVPVERESFKKVFGHNLSAALLVSLIENPSFMYSLSYLYEKHAFQELLLIDNCNKLQDEITISIKDEYILKFKVGDTFRNYKYNGLFCEVMDAPDEFLEFSKKSLSSLEIKCFGYDKQDFFQREANSILSFGEISMGRRIWKVSDSAGVLGYAVGEVFEENIKGNFVQEVVRIYYKPSAMDKNKVVDVLLPELGKFYKANGRVFLSIVYQSDKQPEHARSTSIDKIFRVIINKEGAQQLIKHI